jgi:hypothetical protein
MVILRVLLADRVLIGKISQALRVVRERVLTVAQGWIEIITLRGRKADRVLIGKINRVLKAGRELLPIVSRV